MILSLWRKMHHCPMAISSPTEILIVVIPNERLSRNHPVISRLMPCDFHFNNTRVSKWFSWFLWFWEPIYDFHDDSVIVYTLCHAFPESVTARVKFLWLLQYWNRSHFLCRRSHLHEGLTYKTNCLNCKVDVKKISSIIEFLWALNFARFYPLLIFDTTFS